MKISLTLTSPCIFQLGSEKVLKQWNLEHEPPSQMLPDDVDVDDDDNDDGDDDDDGDDGDDPCDR